MHIIVCRLPKQEEARGYTAKDGELWVERGIQRVKSNVKYRTTEHPEKLFAHDLMVDMALAHMRHEYANSGVSDGVMTFDQLIPEYRANMRTGRYYDEGDPVTSTQLLGKGKSAQDSQRQDIVDQLLQCLNRLHQQEWVGDDQNSYDELGLDMFTLAHKYGDEILWSESHKRTRSRQAHFSVMYTHNGYSTVMPKTILSECQWIPQIHSP
jgi:hypothetical protein